MSGWQIVWDSILQTLCSIWNHIKDGAQHYSRPENQAPRRDEPGPARRNPWVRCPQCYRRVPALCDDAEESCGLGVRCECCTGPHEKTSQKTSPKGGRR
jgi:hypothetical protein